MNAEYIEFIKKFLIHKLYLDYCKQTYDMQNAQTETDIWNEVFKKNREVLKYYLQLSKFINTTANTTKTNTQSESDIYKHKTFQDYIDETINIKTINQFHYQEFIKSMKDDTFKQNFQNKYEDYITETKLKNHLIYIIQSRIKSQTPSNKNKNQKQYYTETEEYEMDTSLNIIPYLEYVSQQRHIQENENENENEKTMTEINEKTIETRALEAIDDFLFT